MGFGGFLGRRLGNAPTARPFSGVACCRHRILTDCRENIYHKDGQSAYTLEKQSTMRLSKVVPTIARFNCARINLLFRSLEKSSHGSAPETSDTPTRACACQRRASLLAGMKEDTVSHNFDPPTRVSVVCFPFHQRF